MHKPMRQTTPTTVSNIQQKIHQLKTEQVSLVEEIKQVEKQLVVARRQQEQGAAQQLLNNIQKTN